MSRIQRVLRAALRDEWDGLDRITRDIRPADWITLTNALAGFLAIILIARGEPAFASIFILAGILLDGADGAAARIWGGGPLGGFLDSLADVITFAIAPAALLATHPGLDARWALPLAALFVLCGIMRLARFEALRETAPRLYFSGMSTPGAALSVTAVLLIGVPSWLIAATAVVASVTMVSRIRYPKLRGGLGASSVAVLLLVLGTWTTPWHHWAVWGMIAFMTTYLLFGPFYVLVKYGATRHPDVALPGAPDGP